MPTIAVIGATGQQGSGVVCALLASTDYAVRAISSNPSSEKAQAFLNTHKQVAHLGRLTIVHGDLAKPETIRDAMHGTYGVFFASPFIPDGREDAENSEETKQGKGVVDAAKETSGGKYTHCTHWDSKAIIADYARHNLKAVTVLVPGAFYSNLNWPSWTRRDPDGTVVFCLPVKPDAQMQYTDERFDLGNFASAVFTQGPAVTAGKTYPVMSPALTPVEMAKQYHGITGEPAKFEPVPLDDVLNSFKAHPEMGGPGVAKEMEDMFNHINDIQPGTTCTGTMKPEDDLGFQDLGVKASTFEAWLERTGWRVGGAGGK
ncbi:hypothetical protein JCM10296v2_005046 [Rhodotorula toruloides]